MSFYKTPLSLLLIAVSSQALAADDLFFSEYIEGSSNNKALEIANLSEQAVDLSQYQIQMYFNGKTDASLTIPLSGSVEAGEVFVIANSRANEDILNIADQTQGSGWFNGDDTIVLVKDEQIIDSIGQIGTDPGSQWGSDLTSTANNTLRRNLPAVLDVNADDEFEPAQQWQGFASDDISDLGHIDASSGGDTGGGEPEPLVCNNPATAIHTIQGNLDSSSMVDQVLEVEAVVSEVFSADNELKGFFIQTEDAQHDDDLATSEGIFVYAPALNTALVVGDKVRLKAKVAEFYNQTQLKDIEQLIVCDQGINLTPASISLPFASTQSAEAVEGMLVEFSHPLTVSENYNLGRYGELVLSNGRLFNPTEIATPGLEANAQQAANDLNRIILDDGSSKQNPAEITFPSGDLSAYNTVRGADSIHHLRGVISYSFGNYRIQTQQGIEFEQSNLRTIEPTLAASDLRIASFNILNYFNGDGQGAGFPTARGADNAEEFERQEAKIISALSAMDAAVIGLMEIENDGFAEHSAIAALVAALNQATGRNYRFAQPDTERVGSDAIAVGLIYDADLVSAEGGAKTLASAAFTDKNRQPLLQTFSSKANGSRFSVVVNHFKSKGSCPDSGDNADQGDGQGCWNPMRSQAAIELADWLDTQAQTIGDDDMLILGDLNAYSMEQPLNELEQRGFNNLLKQFNTGPQYSYVFFGQAGSLDHALASDSLAAQIVDTKTWTINTDEPKVLDYNLEYKTVEQQQNYYADFAYRASDHDPVLIALNLNDEASFDLIDTNQDGVINGQDIGFIFQNLGKKVDQSNQTADLNQDGKINFADIGSWFNGFFAKLFARA